MNEPKQDRIYASERPLQDFVFDEKVADVFTDMINRSVPGYATIISMIGMLADRYCTPGSAAYDLGCSLGGAALAMTHHISHKDSQLEIAQKRSALENVLIPETIADHKARIQEAGFSSCDTWFQCFNFASMVAFK